MTEPGNHGPTAAAILRMPDEDVRRFLRKRLRERSLHTTVQRLNDDALSGSPARRRAARAALDRLGFVD